MNPLRWLRRLLCPLLGHRPLPWERERRVKTALGGDAVWLRLRCGCCRRWLPCARRTPWNEWRGRKL